MIARFHFYQPLLKRRGGISEERGNDGEVIIENREMMIDTA